MTRRQLTAGILGLAYVLAGLAACSDDAPLASETAAVTRTPAAIGTGPASPTSATSPTVTGTSAVPEEVSIDRVMDHLEHLAVEIGARVAGSPEERAAADYIAGVLDEAGYETTIEDFSFEAQVDESRVELGDGRVVIGYAMSGSPNASARGPAAFGGLGRAEDLAGADLRGAVVIFDRGTLTFADKVRAAEAGGAVAAVIVNNEEGPFRGEIGQGTTIPVISVTRAERETLEEALGEQVTVTTDAGMRTKQSQNVVGRAGDDCRGYLGAHYDSVAAGPGANDNASGTAVILEVARVHRADGLCVVAFGAEELGLWGSRAYVEEHLVGTARFLLNVDMAGRLDGPIIVGDRELTASILDAIAAAGVPSTLRAGAFPPFASSDHVSFEAVGVPAVTFNSGDDEFIHTSNDTVERVSEDALDMFAQAVAEAVAALLPEAAPVGGR